MLSAASCRSCGEAKGPCGFGSSQWKRARANKPATCKACALDAENAAPQAVDKAAVLAAFLLRAKQAGGAHRQPLAAAHCQYLYSKSCLLRTPTIRTQASLGHFAKNAV